MIKNIGIFHPTHKLTFLIIGLFDRWHRESWLFLKTQG